MREYEVINHKKGEAKKMKFTINPARLDSQVSVVSKVEIPKDIVRSANFSHAHYTAVM
jgi:phage protein U